MHIYVQEVTANGTMFCNVTVVSYLGEVVLQQVT